jgi:hypothetical protein
VKSKTLRAFENKTLRGILGSEKREYGGKHRAFSYLMKSLQLQSYPNGEQGRT